MDWLTDPWEFEFMRRALLAGAIVALACSTVGAFVVVRGLAFLGGAVAHTSLAGAAVAFIAGGSVAVINLGAAVAAVLTAIGVSAPRPPWLPLLRRLRGALPGRPLRLGHLADEQHSQLRPWT